MAPANDGASGFTADCKVIRSAPQNTTQQDSDVPHDTATVTPSSRGQFSNVGFCEKGEGSLPGVMVSVCGGT